ncbi:hypothetical protein GCM10027275_38800 [Rhabdobacter roseus]|uniref:Type VI secretion system baseplate subunit TssG n=1 Tax=Rhabdobacter roseus TaxID=1655419 RepID=A0A840TVH4_9BACT|nr:type VI secretion system baseplate subunit TssG [Rhabdobacter roseus]MBB5285582.1 hypothetical protein [Rhabdobacter roseus]
MEPITYYAERLNHLPVDLRAEVVLADMLEEGILLDDLILNPVGAFGRASGRDIHRAEWTELPHSVKKWLKIDLNRNGLYDLLPEGLFHQPTNGGTATSKEAILLEMKIQHQREQAARRFFLPIEQEFFRQRIRIEQEERTLPFTRESVSSDDFLGQFWNLPDFLTPSQTKRLLYLLPIMHRIAGNLTAMADCFEQLIEERVSLQMAPPGHNPRQVAPPKPHLALLGQWQLGNNSVFDGWLRDEEPLLQITVHIDRQERVGTYLPGNNGQRLVEWLSDYLVPLDAGVNIELDTSSLENTFLLASDDHCGRLDFTTCL